MIECIAKHTEMFKKNVTGDKFYVYKGLFGGLLLIPKGNISRDI